MSASGGDGYKRSLFSMHGPEAAHHFQRAPPLVSPLPPARPRGLVILKNRLGVAEQRQINLNTR